MRCSSDTDCDNGAFCEAGKCLREQGTCISVANCPPGSVCRPDPTVPASADTDLDGVADDVDNCPAIPNTGQEDLDQDDVGDVCDLQTCGNGTREFDEDCDGADSASCPGQCTGDCACPCTNFITDPKARITVQTRNGAGKLSAKLQIPLASYSTESVSVRLEDNGGLIAKRNVGVVPPVGRSGKKWQFKIKASGLNLVKLTDKSPSLPNTFIIEAKAKAWFTAALANEPKESTVLTVKVGNQCFTHVATRKTD